MKDALADILLPAALEEIADEAFYGASSVTGLVELPGHVKRVGQNAFAQSSVYAVDMPASVTQVAANAVSGAGVGYVIVRNAQAQLAQGAFSGVGYVFGPDGGTAESYASAAGIRFVALESLALHDGFYYEVSTQGATLLCARDATLVGASLTVPASVDGVAVTNIAASAFIYRLA